MKRCMIINASYMWTTYVKQVYEIQYLYTNMDACTINDTVPRTSDWKIPEQRRA